MADRPGAADYLRTLKLTVPTMVDQIKELAAAEIKPAAKHGGIGAGMFGGAASFAWIGLKTLGLTLCFLLSMIFHEAVGLNHLTALTVGFAIGTLLMFVFAGLLAVIGKGQFKHVKAPEATIAETKASIAAIGQAISAGSEDAKNREFPDDANAIVNDPRYTAAKPSEISR